MADEDQIYTFLRRRRDVDELVLQQMKEQKVRIHTIISGVLKIRGDGSVYIYIDLFTIFALFSRFN